LERQIPKEKGLEKPILRDLLKVTEIRLEIGTGLQKQKERQKDLH
jgi:hypothetical protein